tara:strand:- start:289207 stop:289473 length:267 start_codon:yes stop_codon:yes gene_type:complete
LQPQNRSTTVAQLEPNFVSFDTILVSVELGLAVIVTPLFSNVADFQPATATLFQFQRVPLALPVRNFLQTSIPIGTGKASGTLLNGLL